MGLITITTVVIFIIMSSSSLPIPNSSGKPNTEDCMNALTNMSVTGFQSTVDTVKASADFVKFCIQECFKIVLNTINAGSSEVDKVIEEGKIASPISTFEEGSMIVTCFFWCLEKVADAVKTGSSGIFNTASSGKTALQTIVNPMDII